MLAKYDLYTLNEGENPWLVLPSHRLPLFVVGSSLGRIHVYSVPLELREEHSWIGEPPEDSAE